MNKLVLAALVFFAACKSAGMTPEMRTEIQTKVEGVQPQIQACYQKSLTTNRKLRGMVVATFTANGDTGQFQEITLRRDEPNDPVLRYCVVQEIAKLALGKPPGTRIVIDSYPIKFDWTNP
ncbi:MAG TPA: AgmX/PglI C-terminal domain-containing protein [Kofleriaceae bacterium]